MNKTSPNAIKKILPFLFSAASLAMTSCESPEEPLPQELSEASKKDFWMHAVQSGIEDDSANFKQRLAEQLEKGELVILDKEANWSRIYCEYNSNMTAAIVTPDNKDTLAILRYNMDFVVYNPDHQRKTGEVNKEKEIVEIQLKDEAPCSPRPSSVEIESQQSYDTNRDPANSSQNYSFR